MGIAEVGYRPWQGERVSVPWRWLAIARAEIAIAARRKLLRPFMVLAWLPLTYYGAAFFAIGYVADKANDADSGSVLAEIAREILGRALLEPIRENPELFLPAIWTLAFYMFFAFTQSLLAMAVVAMVGPPLIARDVASKAFLLYFSKPISAWEYLLGKLSVVVFFVFAITLFPALVLYVVSIALAPDAGTLWATAPIVLRIVATSVCIAVPLATVMLLLSSLSRNARLVTFAWIALWIVGEIAYRALSVGGARYDAPDLAFVASLRELSIIASSGLLGVGEQVAQLEEQLASRGIELDAFRSFIDEIGGPVLRGGVSAPSVAIGALTLITVAAGGAVMRRVTRPVRI